MLLFFEHQRQPSFNKKKKKKNLNFLNMFPVVVTHMGFLMKYFKAAFSEQFYSFYY